MRVRNPCAKLKKNFIREKKTLMASKNFNRNGLNTVLNFGVRVVFVVENQILIIFWPKINFSEIRVTWSEVPKLHVMTFDVLKWP